jgi:tRNA A37 methylthiotransferase MiaB
MDSVVDETRRLLEEEGIREVILLGQNVNSYHDKSGFEKRKHKFVGDDGSYQTSNAGFSNMFHLRHGEGHRFADLLDAVSALDPELRVRFTSPHPKDYPPALLTLMAERPNICKHLHMPAQSGSTTVLERMRRGYSREAYLELIDDVRRLIPDVAISSDFITGFCGETEEEHLDTISLMDEVQFDQAFMFAYSMRGKVSAKFLYFSALAVSLFLSYI